MKFWVAGFIAVVIVVGGLFIVTGGSDDSEDTNVTTANTTVETEERKTVDQVQEGQGKYIDYSEENVKDNEGKTKIVFFHADWCINCQGLEKNVLAGSIPDDIVILKANFDKDTALKQRYGVTAQTSLVQIDDNGDKVKLWVGSAFDDIESIQEEII